MGDLLIFILPLAGILPIIRIKYTMKKQAFVVTLLISMSLVACQKNTGIELVDKESLLRTNNYTYVDYADYNAYDVDSCPSIGEPKLLIVPIWFTNSDRYIKGQGKQNVREDIEKAYIGTPEETGWHSVSSFYKEESKGKCDLKATVTDWYEIDQKTSYYYRSTGRVMRLVSDAVGWYFGNHPEDSRSNYDTDHDGYLDGVMLIYGCPDYTELNIGTVDTSNLWAYCYWLQNPELKDPANPGPNSFFWASYDFMYDTDKAMERAGTSYGGGDNRFCDVDAHTYIHEMGHVFGLDDYYDYSSNFDPAGSFSMQDYNVGGHDPYSVMALGWANPIVPTKSCQIEFDSFQETHDVVLLSANYGESPFDEYLLLELYTPTGLNEFDSKNRYKQAYPLGPSTCGIRLWHVDARLLLHKDSGDYAITNKAINDDGCVEHAFSNTYGSDGHGSPLGPNYLNYKLLQLIRNNPLETYKSKTMLGYEDLFYVGDTFSISQFQKQFIKENDLNAENHFTWSFTVDSVFDGTAKITFTKEK